MSSKEISDVLEMDRIKNENAEYDYSQHYEVPEKATAVFQTPPFYMLFSSQKKA